MKKFSSYTSRSPSGERRRWRPPRQSAGKSAQFHGCTMASRQAMPATRSAWRRAHQKPSAEPQSWSTRTTG
jgi:hypothetical protein